MSNHTKRGTRAHWGTGAGGGRAEGREEARGSLFLKREGKSGSEPGPTEARRWQAASCQLKIKSLLRQWRASRHLPTPTPTPPDKRKPFAARLASEKLGRAIMGWDALLAP